MDPPLRVPLAAVMLVGGGSETASVPGGGDDGSGAPASSAAPSTDPAQWKQELEDASSAGPDDPTFVQKAMDVFNKLPDEQKQAIDQNARKVWVKKGKPNQDQNGMNQDKARAMYAMMQGHDFSSMPNEVRKRRGPVVSEHDEFLASILGRGKKKKSWLIG